MPNQRMKLTARGGRLKKKRSVLCAAATGRSLCTIRQGARSRVRGVEGRMKAENVAVFFYGLFMDKSLLASRGICPSRAAVGYVDGYGLRIGRRATLVTDETNGAYGVLMTI